MVSTTKNKKSHNNNIKNKTDKTKPNLNPESNKIKQQKITNQTNAKPNEAFRSIKNNKNSNTKQIINILEHQNTTKLSKKEEKESVKQIVSKNEKLCSNNITNENDKIKKYNNESNKLEENLISNVKNGEASGITKDNTTQVAKVSPEVPEKAVNNFEEENLKNILEQALAKEEEHRKKKLNNKFDNNPITDLNLLKSNKEKQNISDKPKNPGTNEFFEQTNNSKIVNLKEVLNIIPKIQDRNKVIKKESKKKIVKQSVLIDEKHKYPIIKPLKTKAEVLQELTLLANLAKKQKRTFTIFGNFYALRRAFEIRGWIEKIKAENMDHRNTWIRISRLPQQVLLEYIKTETSSGAYRKMLLSNLLGEEHQVDLFWSYRECPFNFIKECDTKTIVNRYPKKATCFCTSKAGLCDSLRAINNKCYCKRKLKVLFPRTYNLGRENEVQAFIYDFRHTAAISLLQYIIAIYKRPGKVVCVNDKALSTAYNFAVEQCENFIKHIESTIIKSTSLPKEEDWDAFLENYYTVVSHSRGLKENEKVSLQIMAIEAERVLSKLGTVWPYLNTDGIMNLWLLKPKYGSQGHGIFVCRTWLPIFKVLHSQNCSNYIAQKYIERPLLIYDTKFDIRQWLLVTTLPSLKVWMYRKCYLRFSSQIFTLKKSDEAIHLTNNSVQCKYKNCQRSYLLPEHNMWDSDQFRRYLIQNGQPNTWRDVIYEGMKNALKEVFELHQEELYTRTNRFELFGADFILDENYQPYLLEINCRPALSPSTGVTSRMVPILLTDVVKGIESVLVLQLLDNKRLMAFKTTCSAPLIFICEKA